MSQGGVQVVCECESDDGDDRDGSMRLAKVIKRMVGSLMRLTKVMKRMAG